MLIKSQALASYLRQALKALYILIGQDHFLLNEAAESIKLAWRKNEEDYEESVLTIEDPKDWALLAEKSNSYSLFANYQLIDIRYEKKTLDNSGKEFLKRYLENRNPHCLLLLRAPQLGHKQLQNFIACETAQVVQATSLNKLVMQNWITEQLQKRSLSFEQQVPELIWQYTQGNMLACAQVIEKLDLAKEEGQRLTVTIVKEQLVDQCDYQLFELSEACLSSNADKAIHLLQYAQHTKAEPTLVLWLLTQEIRKLIQLFELTQQALPFNEACNKLKIWSERKKLYQLVLKKVALQELLHLLQFCKIIDERIKSNQSKQVWQALEQVALSLCLPKRNS